MDLFLKLFTCDCDESIDYDCEDQVHEEEGAHDYCGDCIDYCKPGAVDIHQVVHVGTPGFSSDELKHYLERVKKVVEVMNAIVHVGLEYCMITCYGQVEEL